MNYLSALDAVFGWVWRNSAQATPLILLVFLFHKLAGRRLTAGMRHALSLLVLAGLLLPVILPSPLSLSNLLPAPARAETPPQVLWSDAGSPRSALESGGATFGASRSAKHRRFTLSQAAGLLWLGGLAGLVGIASWRYLRWRGLINRARPITEPGILALLEQAKLDMGVGRAVALSAVDQLSSPAVFGVRRVRVLLPEAVLGQLTPAELRLVILHELAHVRRSDVALGWVLMAVQFLHWFNPLVWLALHRIRSDCELVCDALVLKGSARSERVSYGQVLLKLMEDYSLGPRPFSSAVPVVSTKGDIKRRILMLRHHREASTTARLATVALVVVLGCLTLTRARERATEPQSVGPGAGILLVSIDQAGNVRLDGAESVLTLEQFKAALASRAATNSDVSLRIQADQNTPWPQLVKVMDAAQACKIVAISARIDRETVRVGEDGAAAAAPGQFTATNHGMVMAGGAALMADRVTFDASTGTLQADGHVRLWQVDRNLSADHLSYNVTSGQVGAFPSVVCVNFKYTGPRLVSEDVIQTNTSAITEVQSLSSPVFQLRLVVDAPTPDSEPVTLVSRRGDQSLTNVIHVLKTALLDQAALTSARAGTDALGHPIIEVTLTESGKARFAEVTRQNIGKRLAIFIAGTVYQAPVIRTEIAGGAAQISGNFTKAEAEELAAKISDVIGRR